MAGGVLGNSDSGANAGGVRASESQTVSRVSQGQQAPQDADDQPSRGRERADHAWIARLIEREGAGILRMLWRMLRREQDVMDAYQDCFCKLAARKSRKDLKNAKAYAYRTAANVAIEMIRVRSRRGAHLPAVAAQRDRAVDHGHSVDEPEDSVTRLQEAIAQLPDHLRNVVVLRDLSRMSYAQVGRTLGIEPATARVYRRHAVVKLAELLEEVDTR